jgi:hypothetical protein
MTLLPLASLQQSDIDRNRPQGDVGLYVIDSDRFGELPAWLVREREAPNPTYPWPLGRPNAPGFTPAFP